MKIDMSRLEVPKGPPRRYGTLKTTATLLTALLVFGSGMVYTSFLGSDRASADAIYDEREADPSFTVQQWGDVLVPEFGEDGITVLGNEIRHISPSTDKSVPYTVVRQDLYADYETNWTTAGSIEELSMLNDVPGYVLKEIWFGTDAESNKSTDFTVLPSGDLLRIRLTNNPNHPGLSKIKDGKYLPDGDGNYTVPVTDGSVIRFLYGLTEDWVYADADVFDYDVSDGGYYLERDYGTRKEIRPTSGQKRETNAIYVDTADNGIHDPANYEGDGAKYAFGGSNIWTGLAEETVDGGLDTLNVHNYAKEEETGSTGVSGGLVTGLDADGNLVWRNGVTAPDLFGDGPAVGKTAYTEDDYSFGFKRTGFSKILSAVESTWGTCAEELENLTNTFWILDTAPSFRTDGHDPVWGDGNEKVFLYKGGSSPEPFKETADGGIHNPFFGFSYTEDFTIQPGYTGPLDIFCYSDDDLWAFVSQVDEDGKVVPETAVLAADLGGVHDGTAYYRNLWDVVEKIPYGNEALTYRLSVFYTERDGTSADCYLGFTLPETGTKTSHTTSPLLIEAVDYTAKKDRVRTFLFDDGTGNRYKGTYENGESITVVSGEELTIPSGSFLSIDGIPEGSSFTVTEIGQGFVMGMKDGTYEKTDRFTGTAGETDALRFLSSSEAGTLLLSADGEGTPDGSYVFELDAGKETEISALDEHNNPIGSQFTDEDGKLVLSLEAGETILLYGLPEGGAFRLTPLDVPGWHVSEISIDGANVDGTSLSGLFSAAAVYRYEANERQMPQISLQQSVSGDWTDADIVLGTGALLSYNIMVTNPNDVPVSCRVTDVLPEGLRLVTSSLPAESTADGQTLSFDLELEPYMNQELSFTCEVTGEDGIFSNTAVLLWEEQESAGNTVTARIP